MKRTEPTCHLYHGHRYVPSHQKNVRETWRQARERITTTPNCRPLSEAMQTSPCWCSRARAALAKENSDD